MTKINIDHLKDLITTVVKDGPEGPPGASPEEKLRHFATFTCFYALARQMEANTEKKGVTDIDVLSAAASYMMYLDNQSGEITLLCTTRGWPNVLFNEGDPDYNQGVGFLPAS